MTIFRNQDFPTVLRNDTVNMVYVDADNNTLYEGTTFFGYVGIPTGVKFNGFSITIDAREDIYGLQNWIDIGCVKYNIYKPLIMLLSNSNKYTEKHIFHQDGWFENV